MNFYDIHTHQYKTPYIKECEQADDVTIQIENVYPLDTTELQIFDSSRYFSCGIHPWHSNDYDKQLEKLKNIAYNNCIVAIGEAGLDKLRGLEPKLQEIIFEKQIEISETHNKPVIIHCVKSWTELIAIKKNTKPNQPWIIHGYRGNRDLSKQLIRHGFMFSIGEKFNPEALRSIPIELLFCETDDSKLSIKEIYSSISETLRIQPETLAETISLNIKKNFPLIGAINND